MDGSVKEEEELKLGYYTVHGLCMTSIFDGRWGDKEVILMKNNLSPSNTKYTTDKFDKMLDDADKLSSIQKGDLIANQNIGNFVTFLKSGKVDTDKYKDFLGHLLEDCLHYFT